MLSSGPHWLCPQVRSGNLLLLVHSPLPSDWTAILMVSSLACQWWSVLAVSPCHMGVCCVSTPQYMSCLPLPSSLVPSSLVPFNFLKLNTFSLPQTQCQTQNSAFPLKTQTLLSLTSIFLSWTFGNLSLTSPESPSLL